MTYLEFLIAEAMGIPSGDPRVRAAVQALHKARVIDPYALVRVQIQSDSCRDYKQVMRKYHVSRGFVFQCWNSQSQEA
jgi:hypothetical protein